MAIVCWGSLAKAANDTLKIEESILGYIENHDENPNAHMGPDYALGAHRLATMLDHSPYSIFNKFIYPQSRSFKAVVDPTGNGDVLTIQAGIDYVNSIGGGTVFLKPGTYTLAANITAYSNITIEGEDNDTCILDFNSTAYGVVAHGTSPNHLRNIHIKGIKVINSKAWEEGAISFRYVEDFSVIDCKFTNNWDSDEGAGIDIFAYYSYEGKIEDNYAYSSGFLVEQNSGLNILIQGNRCTGSLSGAFIISGGGHLFNNWIFTPTGNAITASGSSVIIENNYLEDCTAHGIIVTGTAARPQINHNIFEGGNETKKAIYLSGSGNNGVIVGNIISGGFGWGIHLDDGDYHVLTSNNIRTSDNVGILIDATCDRTIVVANQLYQNGTPITDNGSNTELGHNIVA